MKTIFRRTVKLLIDAFLPFGKRQDKRRLLRTEDRAFEIKKMVKARCQAIKRTISGNRAADVTEVRAIVDVHIRHFVEADYSIEALLLKVFF